MLIVSVESPDSIMTRKELLSSFGDSLPWSLWPEVEQISLCLKSSPNGSFIGDTDTGFFFFFYLWKQGRKERDSPCELFKTHRDLCLYVMETDFCIYTEGRTK